MASYPVGSFCRRGLTGGVDVAALVRARMGARARVGLHSGRQVGPGIRGHCLQRRSLQGFGFWNKITAKKLRVNHKEHRAHKGRTKI